MEAQLPPNQGPVLNEAMLELRYRPNARIVDRRGSWAENLAAHMGLPHWQIVGNRTDIFRDDKTLHVYVGFRNCGVVLQDIPSHEYFSEQAVRFLKRLFSFEDFGDPIYVERFGVRLRAAFPVQLPFDGLLGLFQERYVQLAPPAREMFGGAQLLDIGAPLNFSDEVGRFNSSTGPMALEQFTNFFSGKEELPDVGLYVDVDYWAQAKTERSSAEIVRMTRAFAQAACRRVSQIRHHVLGHP